jgi:S-methylmethionine-dependent homocysteine/selenocysteine methylase
MDGLEVRLRWLIAGSSGGERAPVERSSATADRWFEPLHVQDPVAARERIAGQVAAGADIVLAPTWRTHRRALMDVGESRRAWEWTDAAVRIAREGVDAGLERRDEVVEDASVDPGPGAESADPEPDDASADPGPDDASVDPERDDGAPPIPLVREPPRVAGVLPLLDDEPEPGTGRLLPREPAAARDYEVAAGHLADADVDLILVETRLGDRGARIAVEAAARTGLPTWVAATGPIPEGAGVEGVLAAWAEAAIDAGATGLLLADGSPELAARLAEGVEASTWGGLLGEVGDRSPERLATDASTWLEVGAVAVALLRGARPDRVGAIRATIDRMIRRELAQTRAGRKRWDAIVARGAAMAPGGTALWVDSAGADTSALPTGFTWTVASAEAVLQLPKERFGLTIARAIGRSELLALGAALQHGGILVAELMGDIATATDAGEDTQLVSLDVDGAPLLAIFRRVR